MTVISPQLLPIYNELHSTWVEGEDFRSLGTQVLWIRASDGSLRKRYIAGTSTFSQHVGGNAEDVAPMSRTTSALAVIDAMVAQARTMGAKVLWRGVRHHYPHHAHIEGVPKYSQAELAAFYDPKEEEDMKELIAELQAALIDAGYDLGGFAPLDATFPPGADGEIGQKTRDAFRKAFEDARWPQEHIHPVPEHKHGVEWPPSTDLITGVPI